MIRRIQTVKPVWRWARAILPAALTLACGHSAPVARVSPSATQKSVTQAAQPATGPQSQAQPQLQPQAQPQPAVSTLDSVRAMRQTNPAQYEAALATFARSDDARTRGRANALLGLLYLDQNNYESARQAFQQAATDDSAVAPFLRLRQIDGALLANRPADAIAAADQIIADSPASSAAGVARVRLPALYAMSGDRAGTDAAYAHIASLAIDEQNEGELVALAASLAKSGRSDLATLIWMRILQLYPQGRFTEDVYGRLASARPSPLDQLPFPEALSLATRIGNVYRYDQALDLLRRIAQRFPRSSTNAAYRNVRIRALFHSRHYAELLGGTSFDKLNDPALLLLRSRAAWRSNRPDEFLAGLRKIERRFPASKEAVEAKILRAKYYLNDEPDFSLAVQNLTKAIAAGGYGNEGENLWSLGWTYHLWGRDSDAMRTFDDYLRRFPDGDFRTNAYFWSGKLLLSAHDSAAAEAKLRELMRQYPYSYYSYRARAILGDSTPAPSEIANGNVFPEVDREIAQLKDLRLDAVDELLWLGLKSDATREMKLIAARRAENDAIQFKLADVFVQGGEPFKANGILQRRFRQFVRHGGANIPDRFWQILFPLSYWNDIVPEAGKRALDPYLIASIIRQESGFEAAEVSNAGAVGLMQIMPEEAGRIAARAGIAGPVTRASLFDPKTNIAVGAAEYSQKLGTMKGNHTLAIAAYNAGEDVVGRWAEKTPVDDVDSFVESIPYSETRLYVKTVMRNRFEYRRIYETTPSVQPVRIEATR
ncbi:MAG TPA: transglycosylase SLT domain-containing protein [Thermoanaerobaculia bacterium]|nr:transglycosylase SLT domain-containing protein [Thermoanaerobaculia bacterium]